MSDAKVGIGNFGPLFNDVERRSSLLRGFVWSGGHVDVFAPEKDKRISAP
jgi:hypothetical protein